MYFLASERKNLLASHHKLVAIIVLSAHFSHDIVSSKPIVLANWVTVHCI